MKEKIIAKRYAEAFLGYVKPTIGFEKAVEELKVLKIILYENPELQGLLGNLQIVYSDKCEVVDSVLKDFSEETRIFIKLLLENGRIKNIIAICDYVRINYSYGEALDVLLKTSYLLDLELIQKIKEKLESVFKRKFMFHIELDADLLGGIQVTVGNYVIDGSVRRRLDELKEKLMTIRVN